MSREGVVTKFCNWSITKLDFRKTLYASICHDKVTKHNRGAERSIIEGGAHIHIFVFTDCENS